MKKPSLLLINPWIYDFASFDLWAKPLGLLYLASFLRQGGYSVNFLDCLDRHFPGLGDEPGLKRAVRRPFGTGKYYREKIEKPGCLKDIPRYYYRHGLSPRLFAEALAKAERPAAILVTSGMTYWYPGVFKVIRACRRTWPEAPVVLGGIYATLCYEHAREFSGADLVIKGPAEDRIFSLLEEITGIRASPPGKGLSPAAHRRGLINQTPAAGDPPLDCDGFPYPAFDLLTQIDYVCLLTSRGCPFRCAYCASHLLSPDFSCRKPEEVAGEILFWHKTRRVQDFAFYDDALLLDPGEHIISILERIIASGIEANFHTPNGLHARFIDATLAGLMRRAGFRTIHLALETVSRRLDNKTTVGEFLQAVRYLKEAGFQGEEITAYLLMGLPGQEPGEVEEAVRLVQKCGVTPYLSEYSPIPRTELWPEAVACSRYDLATEPLTHNNSALPCLSKKFTWEDVKRLKQMALSR